MWLLEAILEGWLIVYYCACLAVREIKQFKHKPFLYAWSSKTNHMKCNERDGIKLYTQIIYWKTLQSLLTFHSFENEKLTCTPTWGMQGLYSAFVAFTSPVFWLFQTQASKLFKKDLSRCWDYLLSILEICRFVKVVPGSYFHTSPPMENKSECQRLFSKTSLINFELCVIGIPVSQCVLCLAVEVPQLSFYANEPVRDIWQNLGWPGSMAFWTLLHMNIYPN